MGKRLFLVLLLVLAGPFSHAALLNNGSFEDCSPNNSCAAPLGSDWDYLPSSCLDASSGSGYAVKDTAFARHATDGQYYFGLNSSSATCTLFYAPFLKYGGRIAYDLNVQRLGSFVAPIVDFTSRDSNNSLQLGHQ